MFKVLYIYINRMIPLPQYVHTDTAVASSFNLKYTAVASSSNLK